MGLRRRAGEGFRRLQERGMNLIRRTSKTSILVAVRGMAVELLYLTVFFTYTAGVVNALLEGTKPGVQGFIIYPARGVQTPAETFIYFFVAILGTVGVYLIYMGGRRTVKRRLSDFYLIIGFTVLLVALVLSLFIFGVKAF